ncbi:MAG: glycosyltransferase family 4 protein [Planctomycetota bacterium]
MHIMRTDASAIERILFIAPELEARGTNEYILHIARELKKRNRDVCVFCAPGPMLDVLKAEQLPVRIFPGLSGRWLSKGDKKAFKEAISEFDPQIVHLQTVRMVRMFSSIMPDSAIPVVLTLHAPPVKPRHLQKVLNDISTIIATSQYVREELVNECEIDKSHINVVPNGIDIDALAREPVRPIFEDGLPVVGCLGPVEKARGHELFLKAAREIARQGYNIQFLVAGEGDRLPMLRNLSTEYGIDDCLTFIGDFSSYAQVLDAVDVVVQSAQVQVSGFSILDAMGRGRPVITFNTGTACEMVESGKTGRVVPMDDVNSLIEAILNLVNSPDKARRMGEAARRSIAENFDIRDLADDILTIYGSLLNT